MHVSHVQYPNCSDHNLVCAWGGGGEQKNVVGDLNAANHGGYLCDAAALCTKVRLSGRVGLAVMALAITARPYSVLCNPRRCSASVIRNLGSLYSS